MSWIIASSFASRFAIYSLKGSQRACIVMKILSCESKSISTKMAVWKSELFAPQILTSSQSIYEESSNTSSLRRYRSKPIRLSDSPATPENEGWESVTRQAAKKRFYSAVGPLGRNISQRETQRKSYSRYGHVGIASLELIVVASRLTLLFENISRNSCWIVCY